MTTEEIAAVMLDAIGNPEAGPLPPVIPVMAQAVADALAAPAEKSSSKAK